MDLALRRLLSAFHGRVRSILLRRPILLRLANFLAALALALRHVVLLERVRAGWPTLWSHAGAGFALMSAVGKRGVGACFLPERDGSQSRPLPVTMRIDEMHMG